MSSGNITDSGNNGSGNGNGTDKIDWKHVASPDLIEQVDDLLEVQITKFDEQSCRRHDKLMKRAAEQEVQRKAEEEAKWVAEEEARRLAGRTPRRGLNSKRGDRPIRRGR